MFKLICILEQVLSAHRPQEMQHKRLPHSGKKTRVAFCHKNQLQPNRFHSLLSNAERLVQIGDKVSALQFYECLHLVPNLRATFRTNTRTDRSLHPDSSLYRHGSGRGTACTKRLLFALASNRSAPSSLCAWTRRTGTLRHPAGPDEG